MVAYFLFGIFRDMSFVVEVGNGALGSSPRMALRTIDLACLFVRLAPRIRKFGTRKLCVVMRKS
jgi:hypothetical protein